MEMATNPMDEFPVCEVCGKDPNDCTCEICPVCGVQGDINCYGTHIEVSPLARVILRMIQSRMVYQ
jgi:hypothetical protein